MDPVSGRHVLTLPADDPGRQLADKDDETADEIYFRTCKDKWPAITSFDLNGGLVVWLLLILYTFLGIAIICDEYFVEALEAISASLKLSDDVAGATFMAAGSSAPELATAIVSVLDTPPGDEGLGTIVGSAVFNIMVIVGVTAICAGQVLDITPYPFARDCVFYTISIGMLIGFISDKKVEWWESCLLIMGYFAYIGFMTQNAKVAAWVEARTASAKVAPGGVSPEGSLNSTALAAPRMGGPQSPRSPRDAPNGGAANPNCAMNPLMKSAYRPSLESETNDSRSIQQEKLKMDFAQAARVSLTLVKGVGQWKKKVRESRAEAEDERVRVAGSDCSAAATDALKLAVPQTADASAQTSDGSNSGRPMANGAKAMNGSAVRPPPPAPTAAPPAAAAPPEQAAETPKKEEEEEEEDGIISKVLGFLGMPYTIMFRFTVPDCRKEKWEKYFMGTFAMSIFWIGLLSYFMLRFSKRAGCIMKIPEVVMGMVVISAGTSVPDALASIFVAKNGQGDMAVSNVLGSNVFNIFLGLGFPWLVYSMKEGGEAYTSEALQGDIVQPILILFIYIGLLLAALVIAKWKLYPKLGYILISLDGLFVLWVLLTSRLGSSEPVFTLGR